MQIVGCALGGPVACGALSGVITLASGGSVVEALTAMALSWAQIGVSSLISDAMHVIQATYGLVGEAIHAGVHGVIGGAVAIAQGGSFLQGFVSNSIGVIGGSISGFSIRGMDLASTLGRTLIAAAAGCALAVATGSKCAQAAVTAAFASLYNGDGISIRDRYKHHEEMVKLERAKLEAAGFFVTERVTFVNSDGMRVVVDLVASTPGFPRPNPQFLVDVKTGNGALTPNQTTVYPQIEKGPLFKPNEWVTPVGWNSFVAGFIPYLPVKVPYRVDIPRYPGLKKD